MRIGVARQAEGNRGQGTGVVRGIGEIEAEVFAVLGAKDDLRVVGTPCLERCDGLLTVVGRDAGMKQMDGADVQGVAADGDFEAGRTEAQALGLRAEDGPKDWGVLAVEGNGHGARRPVRHTPALDEQARDPQVDALGAAVDERRGEAGLAVALHDLQIREVRQQLLDLGIVLSVPLVDSFPEPKSVPPTLMRSEPPRRMRW